MVRGSEVVRPRPRQQTLVYPVLFLGGSGPPKSPGPYSGTVPDRARRSTFRRDRDFPEPQNFEGFTPLTVVHPRTFFHVFTFTQKSGISVLELVL